MSIDKNIAKRLKELRGNTPQTELAEELGVSVIKIRRFEQGVTPPNLDLVIKYSNYYNVSADFIIFGNRAKELKDSTRKICTHTVKLTEHLIKKYPDLKGTALQENILKILESLIHNIDTDDPKAIDRLIDMLSIHDTVETLIAGFSNQ